MMVLTDRQVVARALRDAGGILVALVVTLLLARLLPPGARAAVIVASGALALALLAMVPRWAASERGAVVFRGPDDGAA